MQSTRTQLACRTPDLLLSPEVLDKLTSLLSYPHSALSALYLFSLVQDCDCTQSVAKRLCLKLQNLRSQSDAEKNPIVNHSNPLLLCIALTETCFRFSHFQLLYRDRFSSLATFFRAMALDMQSQYTEYRHLKVLYTEKGFGTQCVLDVITINADRYRCLLKNDIVVAIVQDLWTGGEEVGLNFQSLCLLTHVFTESETRVYTLHTRPPSAAKCALQLYYWKHNTSLKMQVEAFTVVVMCCLGISGIILFVSGVKVVMDNDSTTDELALAKEEMTSAAYISTCFLAFSASLVLFQIQRLAYLRLLRESQSLEWKDIVDILLFLSSTVMQSFNSSLRESNASSQEIITMSEIAFSVVFLLAGIRLSLTLLILPSVGPMIRMVFAIMKDILTFVVLYLLALVTCAALSILLFHRSADSFGSILLSMRTLIQWSVSGVDFGVFIDRKEAGSVFGTAWVFISAVLLLNLLIAVLSTRYEQLAPQCASDYISVLYSTFKQTRYQPPYGALVLAPAPISFLTAVLVPLYSVFPASAKRLNRLFSLLSYQPLFVCGTLLFVLYSCGAAGVAFVHVILELLQGKRILQLMVWLVIGPLYLVLVNGKSTLQFWKVLYSDPSVADSDPQVAEIYGITQKLLRRLCWKREGPVYITMAEIESLISPFPKEKVQQCRKLSDLVPLVLANRLKVSSEQRKLILDLFEQFKSYSPGSKCPENDRVDVVRMDRFFQEFAENPQRLRTVNIHYSQKALLTTH